MRALPAHPSQALYGLDSAEDGENSSGDGWRDSFFLYLLLGLLPCCCCYLCLQMSPFPVQCSWSGKEKLQCFPCPWNSRRSKRLGNREKGRVFTCFRKTSHGWSAHIGQGRRGWARVAATPAVPVAVPVTTFWKILDLPLLISTHMWKKKPLMSAFVLQLFSSHSSQNIWCLQL